MGGASRLEIRGRSLRFGLAVSAVIVAAGAVALARWPHAWPWLATATALIAAGAPAGLTALTMAQQRRAGIAQVTRQSLQGTANGVLPKVRHMPGLDARVHRAVLPILTFVVTWKTKRGVT